MSRLLFAPVNSSSLAAYRMLFGLINAVGLIRFWYLGWIERCFTAPQMMFKYLGFEWVQMPPGELIYVVFAVLIAACVCVSLGLFTRAMSLIFFLGFTYIELLDQSNYLNHYYLICLLAFINIFLPLGARWSLDTWLGLTERREWVPAWTLNWLRLQVATVYFFAGLAKLTSDWLLKAQPLNIWLTSHTDMPIFGPLFAQGWSHYAMSWAGFLFDLTIAFWMMVPRARPYAYLTIIGFHAMTWALFPIGMFPFIMVGMALVFFSDEWPLKLARVKIPRPPRLEFSWRPALVGALALWAVIQWTVPLRHFLYPGNVLWNEEGMRFSWKVMVREKNGEAVFRVREKSTGRHWYVTGSEYLLRHQEEEMSGNPDMILQFAHFLKKRFAEGGKDVEVYAETRSAFNGRPAKPLIDDRVDLSLVNDSLWPKPWIASAPEEEPRALALKRPSL